MQCVAWKLVLIFTVALALRASAETTDWRGAVFRSINEAPAIKIVSDDELEFTPERDGPNLVCKYSRNGDMLRVVVTLLGSPQAVYFKFTPEGLQCADGSILYDSAHFEAASRAAREASAAQRERQLAAARAATPIPAPSPASTLSGPAAKAFAISAPRPEYPYEMRTRHITGSGVVLMIIDVPSGLVTDVSMAQSTGSPVLDNAAISAFRRWRFKPGTVAKVRMPITFTMTGASY